MSFRNAILVLLLTFQQIAYANLTPLYTSANQLQGRNISATAPTNGQVLTWNNGTSVWEPAASGSAGTVTSVAASVPAFLSISGSPITTSGTLAISYSGTALPVANGGTGLTSGTSGGVLAYTASGTLASSGVLSQGQVVVGGGAGVAPSVLAAGTQYQNLRMGALFPSWGAVTLDQSAAVTGTLPIGNGGTGQTTAATAINALVPTQSGHTGELLTTNGTVVSWAAGSGFAITALTGDITGTGPGSTATTIATGAVTDTKSSLANKPPFTVAATSNLTLSGVQTIDGQLTVAGTSIVLATAQSNGTENGPWVVQSGAWTRPTWYPNGGTTQSFQFITALSRLGSIYQGTTWRQTSGGAVTIGSTSTTWAVTPLAINPTTSNGLFNTTATKTANYTIVSTDVFVYADTTSGAFNLTLPDPSTVTNKTFYIKDVGGSFGTNNLTVVRFGSEQIEGVAASLVLSAKWGMYGIRSNGTNWFKVGTNSNRASKTFTTSGSIVIQAGVTQLIAFGRGGSGGGSGGSGGGGGSTTTAARGGAGGSSGGPAITRSMMTAVVPNTTCTVTIGAGGTAGTSGAGAVANAAGASGTNGGAGGVGGDTVFCSLITFKGQNGGQAPVAGGLATTGTGGTAAKSAESVGTNGANGGLANASGGGAAGTVSNSFFGASAVGGAGGAGSGATGGGGGGGSQVTGADGDALTNAAAVGGAGGNGADGGAGGAGATQTGAGVGGSGGGGGGGGGIVAVTGSNGGAGGAGSAGQAGYLTLTWSE